MPPAWGAAIEVPDKLKGLKEFPLAQTTLYKMAAAAVDWQRSAVDKDYALPIYLYFLITFIGFVTIFLGYSRDEYFLPPTVLLGGLENRNDPAVYQVYQIQTFAVMAMAFIGSYVYAIGRILDRINTNDLYPISLYYYTARIVIACTAAAVLRHVLVLLTGPTDAVAGEKSSHALLILIGFAVGFAPDLFILVVSRRAFQALRIWGNRSEPPEKLQPSSLPLLMIDDLSRDKIDRLNELGIDSAQILARQNPLALLPRVPYELNLLLDWVSQAQLYVLVRDEKLGQLREKYVRNILDLGVRLQDANASKEICRLLGLADDAGPSLLQQLEADPGFLRLRELSQALRPGLASSSDNPAP